jgi:cell division protein FtsI (penicillin-binding protein 3)
MPATITTAVPVGRQTWRISLAMLAFAGLFVAVGMRLHHLQVDEGEHLAQMGERQRTRTWTIAAARGNLYDREGSPLAVSDGTWTVTADPAYMDDRLRATVELSRILGLDRDHLRREFENPRNGRTIAKNIDDEKAAQVKALKLTGVNCQRQFTRRYPEGPRAAHVLGFVHNDGKGGGGIEQVLDQILSGKPGTEMVTVDALGKPSITDRESVPAHPGAHIQLTLDLAMQRIVEEVLAEQVAKTKPANAAAILLRPGTGEIMAMASWPSFDPADLTTLTGRTMRNNVLTFVYEPGSTFKPLVAGAAVAERLTNWQERIYCERGTWTFRDGRASRPIRNSHAGNEMLSVVEGISQSDNILMAKLGIRLGSDRLYRWVNTLGFGARTGICLPGDEPGIVHPRSHISWKNLTQNCMSMPMGHAIGVTPLQLALAHNAIASGGEWLPPRLVRRVYTIDDRGREVEQAVPPMPPPRRIYTALDAAQIQEAMTHTMSDTRGTGKNLRLDGYTSAGKTGTAEKYKGDKYVGSFVCWAPAEPGVRPELLCLVVIDEPSEGSYYGGSCAGPAVRTILQRCLQDVLRVPQRADLVPEDDDGRPVKPSRQAAAVPRRTR